MAEKIRAERKSLERIKDSSIEDCTKKNTGEESGSGKCAGKNVTEKRPVRMSAVIRYS